MKRPQDWTGWPASLAITALIAAVVVVWVGIHWGITTFVPAPWGEITWWVVAFLLCAGWIHFTRRPK